MAEFTFKPVTAKPQQPKPDLRDPLGVGSLIAGATQLQPKEDFNLGKTVKQFTIPNRGFTDTQIKEAKPTFKEKATGVAKGLGEIGVGGAFLATKFGGALSPTKFVFDKVFPKAKEKQLERIGELDKFTQPNTAGEAKAMRGVDIAGFLPVGSIGKVSKLDNIINLSKNSIKNAPTGVREKSLDFFRNNPDEITKGEVRLREVDGNIVIEDGRHRLQVASEAGVTPKIVDVTSEYTGKPSEKVAELISGIKPVKVVPKPQERKFITAAKKIFPDNAKLDGSYFARNTEQLGLEARKLVDESPEIAKDIALTGTDERAVAVASEYLNKLGRQAAKTEDLAERARIDEEAATIANSIAEKLTELGRGVQAASLFNRLTPEGQLRTIAKNIKEYNRKNPDKTIPELDGKQAREILDEARRIQAITDPEQRAIEWNKFQRNNQDLFPTPTLKKITTIWKAGLLTGIKTSGLNLFSNASHFLTESVKQYPASLADALASTVTGKRTTTATQRGIIKGLKEGKIKGKRYFFTGFDERNVGEKLDYNRVNFNNKVFQVYTDTVFRTLGASDQPFYYAASARSMFDQALAQSKNAGLKGKERMKFVNDLVENPTDEMYHYAAIDATTAVFQNKTNLGKIAKAFQNIPYVGQFLVPFAQTPSAVAMQIINYSPIGAVSETVKQIAKGKFDQRLWSQAVGRSTVGTIPLYIGYKLGEAGLVQLDYPQGDERQIELNKAEGVAYNSIKMGDKWRSPIVLGPAGNLVLMGAYFQKSIAEDGSPAEAMANAATGLWESFTEQTFLTGIKNFVEGATDIKSGGINYVNNLIASFIPTLISDVAKSSDPLERQSGASVVSRTAARIPGARQQLLPQTNILGQPIERKGNVLETMIDPTRPSKDVSTPVTKELRRLMDEGYKASPTKLGDRSGYDSLSGTQNNRLWQLAGGIVEDKLNVLFITPEYKNATDEQKTKVIQRVTEMSQNVARAQILAELTQGMTPEQAKPILEKHKESKLLNETVFKIYMQIR